MTFRRLRSLNRDDCAALAIFTAAAAAFAIGLAAALITR